MNPYKQKGTINLKYSQKIVPQCLSWNGEGKTNQHVPYRMPKIQLGVKDVIDHEQNEENNYKTHI